MKIDLSQYDKQKKEKAFDLNIPKDISLFKRFSDKQKEDFYREFSTLINSGIDFNQALKILIEQQKSKHIKAVLIKINEDVVKGKSLFEAIQSHKHFTPYEYYSIKIGEDSRRLPEVFKQLQKYFSRKISMRRQIISVLAYPAFVMLITFAVLYFMLNFVVPMFSSVFQQFGKELPAITQFVVRLSDNFNIIAIIFFTSLIGLIVG